MKILLIHNASLTIKGQDVYMEPKAGEFANELSELGNKVTVFGQMLSFDNAINSYELKRKGVEAKGNKRKKNKLLNYFLLNIKAVIEIFRSDFIYIFYPNSLKYLALISIFFGKKYGLYIRGEQGIENRFSKFIYKKAFTVFTVSDSFTNMVNEVAEREVANTLKPMMIHSDKDIAWDRQFDKEKKEFNILFLGRVAFDKGLEELLNAIRKLFDLGYKLKLTMVGDGEFMQRTKELIKELELDDIISLEGAVFDKARIDNYYLSSDIYILPTYHEGFPRTLYEAMIFATPIIATFVGGIPGLMKDGYNCKRIEPKSIDSIVEGLEYAFNNYPNMIEYAENGRITVEKIVDSKRPSHAEHLNQIINLK